MEPHELIVCRDVSLGYEGQTVLSHLNLTIRDGDYLCIVGDNGSGKSTRAQKSQALMNLGKLGVLEWKDKSYRELSGGQQQRVLLARALCAAGRLLILDEPITGLDPAAAQDLYKTLSYLNTKEGMAIVMVTHDLGPALRSARSVLHIGQRGTFLGPVADYLASPQGRRFREVGP